jgi:hypothetical protein
VEPKRAFFRIFLVLFSKFLKSSETLDMSSKQLEEIFEGDCADMCVENFSLLSMGG